MDCRPGRTLIGDTKVKMKPAIQYCNRFFNFENGLCYYVESSSQFKEIDNRILKQRFKDLERVQAYEHP